MINEIEPCVFERIDRQEEVISFLKNEIVMIHRKLDELIAGPALKNTFNQLSDMRENVDRNLKSLNDMILSVKGLMSQMRSVRGRKSDWDNHEINAKPSKDLVSIEYDSQMIQVRN
jgi:hypothetical protein